MKIVYKGCSIDAHRAKSMGGDTAIYYSIFCISDNFEVMSGFSYGTDTIVDFVSYLKDIVDDFIEDPQAYYKTEVMEELDWDLFDDQDTMPILPEGADDDPSTDA